jgi:hypothetical protein
MPVFELVYRLTRFADDGRPEIRGKSPIRQLFHSTQTGLKITREQKQQINLQWHRTLPQYNYTIRPHKAK